MAGIPEKRARQAAAMVMASGHALLDQMCVSLLPGGDPADPYNWADPALFGAYMRMRNALDVGDENSLGIATFKFETCQGCHHFAAIQSPQAHEKPVENIEVGAAGFCTAHPPMRVGAHNQKGAGTSFWVPVDREQVCGEFRMPTSRKIRL